MTLAGDPVRQALLRRSLALEYVTLAWMTPMIAMATAVVGAGSGWSLIARWKSASRRR